MDNNEPWAPETWNDQTDPWEVPPKAMPSLSARLNMLYYMHKHRDKFNVDIRSQARLLLASATLYKMWIAPNELAFISHVCLYPDRDYNPGT